jgi:hypothetical protein
VEDRQIDRFGGGVTEDRGGKEEQDCSEDSRDSFHVETPPLIKLPAQANDRRPVARAAPHGSI